MADEHEDVADTSDTIDMVEVLAEEQKLEEDAMAVLGASDAKYCTFPQGVLPRQALYSCMTCIKSEEPPAGVCLACSLDCHEGHDLIELYTKRNFICDCGNDKFGERKCKLFPVTKPGTNENNLYNQNFNGLYCICHRPYPDPEDHEEDSMVQCVICEDWYHGRHLKTNTPDDDQFEELTCYQCVEKHSFLRYYTHLHVLTKEGQKLTIEKESSDSAKEHVSVTSDESGQEASTGNSGGKESVNSACENESEKSKSEISQNDDKNSETVEADSKSGEPNKDSAKTDDNTEKSEDEAPSQACKLCELDGEMEGEVGSLFWKGGWRKELCTCTNCKTLYEEHHIPFITDVQDTITAYEARGRGVQGSSGTQYERGLEALSQMDRVQQVEMMHGFNDLNTELKDYLKKFADNGKVVREEDIKEFFSSLAGRKKQKVNMSYYCK